MSTKKYPTLLLHLTGLENSEYALKGTEKSDSPQWLAAPNALFIPLTSVVKQKDNTFKKIRHIRSASSIFVDEQEKQGVKPNPLEDAIIVTGQALSIDRAGRDVNAYDYLLACEYNLSNENRPADARALFEIIDTEAKAEKGIDTILLVSESQAILNELVRKVGDEYRYEEEKIDYFCKLFDIVEEGYATKFQKLALYVAHNPKVFLDTVRDSKDKVRQLVIGAEKFEVINFSAKGVSLNSTGAVIKQLTATKRPAQVDEFIDYLQSAIGAADMKMISIALENKKTESVATV